VDGYIERLFIDYTGVEVKAGDHLVEIYSPDLVVAQQELLLNAGQSNLAEAAKGQTSSVGTHRCTNRGDRPDKKISGACDAEVTHRLALSRRRWW
jgi:hypothetical protein